MAGIQFDYFTAAETEQYTFYRIPKALFTERHFQELSCEAKVLYGMMLDRLGLSIRNQWFDSRGRAYIIFTVEDVMGIMGCQSQKAVRLMKELDTADGIGLIEKKRIGLGRPNRIYVKNFMIRGNGGTGTGTGDAGRMQTDAADFPHSAGISGEKAAESKGQPHCDGTVLEMKADTAKENAAGTIADTMPETQEDRDQDWWMRGESIPESEKCGKSDGTKCREESSPYEKNWWDMEADDISGAESLCQGIPLCKTPAAGAGMPAGDAAGIADTVDIVDNCRTAGNFMDEYQNSGQEACFTPEMRALEKCQGSRDMRMQPGNVEWNGLQNPYPDGGRPETDSRETVFADKTVEAMVRELLWEQKTGPSGGVSECVRELRDISGQAGRRPEIQGGEGQDTVTVENEMPEQRDSKRNDTEYSKTEYSKTEKKETDFSDVYTSYQSNQSYQYHTDLSGYHTQDSRQHAMPEAGGTDGISGKMDSYRSCIRENIDYQCFRPQDMEGVDELVELMADTMLVPDRGTVRIAGAERPAFLVKSRFMKLVHSHIEYVMDCMQKHIGKIRNIKAYLLTALYNSSLTIGSYYQAEVNHDLYGCGC